MTRRAVIRSCGSYLPERICTNKDLEEFVETSDEWIVKRTGIRERRIAGDHESTVDMAVAAAQAACQQGDIDPASIDTVIVATSTPDNTFPSVAVSVQARLGVPVGPAFDLQAVCSGFVYGLSVANSFILSGQSRRVLLIGAEKMSSLLNWDDRTTCVLFGDGAGAIILEASEGGQGTLDDQGIFSTHLYADGQKKPLLYTNGGPATSKTAGHIQMQGKDVFRYAVEYMADIVEEVLTHNDITPDQIDWLVPHQANIRIIEATAKKLDMPMEQVVVTVDRHGNTSAASIPLALAEAVNSGQIKRGDMLLFEALGAGLTWGAALARF